MAILTRIKNHVSSRLQSLTLLQRLYHTVSEGDLHVRLQNHVDSYSAIPQAVDKSKWRKVDARKLGIKRSMIPSSSWIVLNVLKKEGFEVYLVGGCVRDLILNRAPKDYDVITTAQLKQIRNHFHRSIIIGQRFPICQVRIRGSVIEVSSFDTVAQNTQEKGNNTKGKVDDISSQVRYDCDESDLVRWRNSMHRDFTINSLFLDPFAFKVYDYMDGMTDLKSLMLRTLIPSHESFKEDNARIMRGLRIAARLNLSISKDTETAIHDLSSSIESLDQFRIMMEMNYMLSYGAAMPSISLLKRFNLLGTLLPFQAAYLVNASKSCNDSMLMKLLHNMDKLVSCDQPTDCRLWVGLLAFHLALVNKPQKAPAVLAFAAVLYYGNWSEAINFARDKENLQIKFAPEISKFSMIESDELLAEEVMQLASCVQDSVSVLTETEALLDSLSKYPNFHRRALVFVPKRKGRDVAQIFDELVSNIQSYENRKESMIINYDLLGKGDPSEISFVLGKIIMETMGNGVAEVKMVVDEKIQQQLQTTKENSCLKLSDIVENKISVTSNKKRHLQASIPALTQKTSMRQETCNSDKLNKKGEKSKSFKTNIIKQRNVMEQKAEIIFQEKTRETPEQTTRETPEQTSVKDKNSQLQLSDIVENKPSVMGNETDRLQASIPALTQKTSMGQKTCNSDRLNKKGEKSKSYETNIRKQRNAKEQKDEIGFPKKTSAATPEQSSIKDKNSQLRLSSLFK